MSKIDPQTGLPRGYNYRPDWEVTPRQVRDRLHAGEDLVLLDCRTPDEYALCKIEGAQLVPLQMLNQYVDQLEELRDRSVVVHCHHGGRSLQMTAVLRQQGFADVKSMAGGIDVWAQDIEPGMTRY